MGEFLLELGVKGCVGAGLDLALGRSDALHPSAFHALHHGQEFSIVKPATFAHGAIEPTLGAR